MDVAPDDCARFEADYHAAILQAGVEFDLAPVEVVVDRWWGIAELRMNPLTPAERQLVESARLGVEAGWVARPEVNPAPH